jgi:type IV pilus assembly protein PilA
MIKLRESMTKKEEGFTLIELMVVVLIIAILIAIAIPTFLGARKRAQDRAAQSDLRNALTAEKTYYTDTELFTTSATALAEIEPSLSWVNAAPTLRRQVWPNVSTAADAVCIVAKSMSGSFYGIRDIATGAVAGTRYFKSEGSSATAAAVVTACALASPAVTDGDEKW